MFQNEIGEKVNVSIGGIAGSKYSATGEYGKQSVYISLESGYVSPTIIPTTPGTGINGGIGLQINTGSLNPMDMNYGQFLIAIISPIHTFSP
jgi:hypothetical protein